jgi:hypothetical protein
MNFESLLVLGLGLLGILFLIWVRRESKKLGLEKNAKHQR